MPRPPRKKYRSSLEDAIIAELQKDKVSFKYEALKIRYQKKPSTYTPDLLLDNGIIIEIKGYFDAEDRTKHLLIKDQHPELDIRFVFQSSKKKIHKSSDTTYADWANKHGFKYADKTIPTAWIQEKEKEGTLEPVPTKRRRARSAD